MAYVRNECCIECCSGKISSHLSLGICSDGRCLVRELSPHSGSKGILGGDGWSHFHDVLNYAKEAENREEYVETARRRRSTPLEVATADFFHPPEICSIDVSRYHGHVGDVIEVTVVDNVSVASVGVLIVDEAGRLVEMGSATLRSGDYWSYVATKNAKTKHVRVIVDAADLPGHLSEKRVEKEV